MMHSCHFITCVKDLNMFEDSVQTYLNINCCTSSFGMARKRGKERQESGYKNKSWICKGARVVFHGSKNGLERVVCKRKERKAAKAKKEEGWVSLVLSFCRFYFIGS